MEKLGFTVVGTS